MARKIITVIGGSPVRMFAVYAIGTNYGPTWIWYAPRTDRLIEPGSDQKIIGIGWAPESKPARRVAKRCHRILIQAGKKIGNASDERKLRADDLFNIGADWARRSLRSRLEKRACRSTPMRSSRNCRSRSQTGAMT